MAYTYEKVSGNKVKFTFTVPAADMESAMEQSYRKNRKQIQVPGFRPGKAPRAVIERMYGKGIFFEDAFEKVFFENYFSAVKDTETQVVDEPSLSDLPAYKAGEDFTFSCEVFVRPEVKLGEYKGLEATKITRVVTEEEIQQRLSQEQKNVARVEEVEGRALENGDIANIDYLGTVDGVPFDGGAADHYDLTIGSGSFIPGFEEQLIGMNPEEERDIHVTFPQEYHAEDLAGKAAVFHVKLNHIEREELPELDDEFAAEVSEFDTLEEYKQSIRDEMQKGYDDNAEAALKNELIVKAAMNAEVDIPARMIEDELDERISGMERSMQASGLSLEQYMKWTGMDLKKLRDNYRPGAEQTVRVQLTLDAIAKEEGLEVSEEELEAEYKEIAESLNEDVEHFKARLEDYQHKYVKENVLREKAQDLIVAAAAITEKTAEEVAAEEAAEKAAAAAEAAEEATEEAPATDAE